MEALGLLDAIISTINDSPKKSFSKNQVIVNKEQLIDMLEKLRLVIQRGGDIAQNAIQAQAEEQEKAIIKQKLIGEANPELFGVEGEALLRQAKEEALKIKNGADKYADSVLNNLLVIVAKMQRTIENGKQRLSSYKNA